MDLAYCSKHGIKVANVRTYSTDAVAQHTFALCLYVLEKLCHYDEYVKSGAYASQSRFSNFDESFFELQERPGVSSAWEISDARLHRLPVRLDAV